VQAAGLRAGAQLKEAIGETKRFALQGGGGGGGAAETDAEEKKARRPC